MRYENTPTDAGVTPTHWPAQSTIARGADRSTLIMFLHPHCPCSSASVAELNRTLTHCANSVTAHVLFVRPKGVDNDWMDTSLRNSAAAIPGVKIQIDNEGREAGLFGAESSGYVVLYNREGKLLFSGGITSARGHEGDNTGENLIVADLNGQVLQLQHTPVYGCSLQDKCVAPQK